MQHTWKHPHKFTLFCDFSAVYNLPFLSACLFLFGWTLAGFLLPSQHLPGFEYSDAHRSNNPLTSAYLLQSELHSSHAPPTCLLSLLLFMHESLSFFLLTNVRASQKRLHVSHLLRSIKLGISSTNCQYVFALGHNLLASLVDDSHFIPHSPIFHLPFCLCSINTCFKRS